MRINDSLSTCMNIILTNECDDICEYCDFPQIPIENRRHITKDDINYIDSIVGHCFSVYDFTANRKDMVFLGGEVGLLDYDTIVGLVGITKKYSNIRKIEWATNGLLIDKYRWIIDTGMLFDIHITERRTNIIPIVAENVKYTLVLTKNNSRFVYDTAKLLAQAGVNSIKIKSANSIRNGFAGTMEHDAMFKHMFFDKFDCDKRSLFFSLDFTNNTMWKCCRSYSKFERKPMTIENIDLAFEGKLFSRSNICNTCRRIIPIKYNETYLHQTNTKV